MTNRNRNWPRENGRDSASSLSASGSPQEARNAVRSVLRRQGTLLHCVLSACVGALCAHACSPEAEQLGDCIKPLADLLRNFEWDEDTTPGGAP